MQLRWGTYAFPVNGCDLTSRTRLVTSDSGRPVRYVTRVDVEGELEGDGQAALSAQEAALRAALLINYVDLAFRSDSGGVTAVSLLNSASLSGVRVVDGPIFAGSDGAEYATLRRFSFTVEAEFVIANAANAVLSFTETLSITGDGGPDTILRIPINVPLLVRQQISPRTPVFATQTGRAVGHTKYPPVPGPLWPRPTLQGKRTQINRENPRQLGLACVEYPVSWSYQYESDVPLVGVPGLPPL